MSGDGYTNYGRAKEAADAVDRQIINAIESDTSFLVEAGAGAGKTYSLNKTVEWLEDNRWDEYKSRKQRIACITYTNAAVDVIKARLRPDSVVTPSTIHSFAWSSMAQYQSTISELVIKLGLLPAGVNSDDYDKVSYSIGVRYVDDDTLYLSHSDIIKLFSEMLDKQKFRVALSREYPIILIDEYQDSSRLIVDKIVRYFIAKKEGPIFGFFGDAWQTIYASNGACGMIEHANLQVIKKTSNFRSAPRIVEFLNKVRPQLQQISASDGFVGEVLAVHCDDFYKNQESKGDLPSDELKRRLNSVRQRLGESSSGNEESQKVLMLTHRLLSEQQGYENLLKLLGAAFKSGDDDVLNYFLEVIEPIYAALESKDAKLLCDALGTKRVLIECKRQKRDWRNLREQLSKARKATVRDLLQVLKRNKHLIPISETVKSVIRAVSDNPSENYRKGTVEDLANLSYAEFINAKRFFDPAGFYSTDHGVKGQEYDNVIFVIGSGWNLYNFQRDIPRIDEAVSDDRVKRGIERNRNLFYVCCSRPRKRLLLFITQKVRKEFQDYLVGTLGSENYYSYSEYMQK